MKHKLAHSRCHANCFCCLLLVKLVETTKNEQSRIEKHLRYKLASKKRRQRRLTRIPDSHLKQIKLHFSLYAKTRVRHLMTLHDKVKRTHFNCVSLHLSLNLGSM